MCASGVGGSRRSRIEGWGATGDSPSAVDLLIEVFVGDQVPQHRWGQSALMLTITSRTMRSPVLSFCCSSRLSC
jgi:hypothetical protein